MNSINVCFSLKQFSSSMSSNDIIEKDYQTVYKPIAKFLYSHPNFHFSFCFSGIQLQFFKKKRGEFISICRELVDRKQLEIIGGSFYDAVLPLLYNVDRNGQIDLLSTEIRQSTGKRPRGISLFADCWDASLVNNLQTCGIEYVLLDGYIIPADKRTFLPLIMSDLGKTIEIFPYYDNLLPNSNLKPEDFIDQIIKSVEKVEKKDKYVQFQPDRIVNININHETMAELVENNWFDKLNDYLEKNPDINITTTTPSNYKHKQIVTIPAYITGGINNNLAKWITQKYIDIDFTKHNNSFTVHDFMENFPQSKSLYHRMMYVSMLVNQYKKDKVRKKSARDKLWQAQNGSGLLCTSNSVFSYTKYRQQCYKYLNEAEKILRDCDEIPFLESLSCFDYNNDGLKEYVSRMKNYFAYISLKGGAVQEFDVLKSGANYTDNLLRISEYDDFTDDYDRGLFIDHIFNDDQFNHYIKGENVGDGVFSKIHYSLLKIINSKHEIQLFAEAVYKPTKQKISLIKKYIFNSNGMTIQYILRNESNSVFRSKFAVESNIANINFNKDNYVDYTLDVVDSGKKLTLDTTKSTSKNNSKKQLKSVYQIRLSDVENGIAFDFEPNEICCYCFNPIKFKRPTFLSQKLEEVGITYCSTLYWNIEIEPGKEIEKYINFTLSSIKKIKK